MSQWTLHLARHYFAICIMQNRFEKHSNTNRICHNDICLMPHVNPIHTKQTLWLLVGKRTILPRNRRGR
jgi:hypothetical protein